MQEEIEQKSFNLMISTTKLSARTVLRAVKAAFRLYQSKASQGKQSVRTLLRQLQHPQDTPHARIYDRLTSMCAPVRFTGSNFRKETAQEKLERLKQLMKQRKESL